MRKLWIKLFGIKKWEYLLINFNTLEYIGKVEEIIDKDGEDGWELVSVVSRGELEIKLFFKRPKK